MTLAWLMLLLAPLAGCASNDWVTLRSAPRSPLADTLMLLSRGGPKPTERTVQLLRQYDLDKQANDTEQVLAELQELIVREPTAEKLYSYAELAYIGGRKAEIIDRDAALNLYGASVCHSYLYLFDPRYGPLRNPYDPQFRGACDLYNGALEGALRLVKKEGALRPGVQTQIATKSQTWDVTVTLRGNSWKPEHFNDFEFVSDYEINGLKNQHHTYGLGVPLIAQRKAGAPTDPAEKYYPPGLSFPVTAFLRLLPDDPNAAGSHHRAVLELYDPLESQEVVVDDRRVPLESDLSTPLAYFLNDPALDQTTLSTAGLLSPDEPKLPRGVYMLEPYQPQKIPVLMVHGLWSSPITWMEMFNDLRSSPELRDNYQFWFYLYPTGQPFWHSATQMRGDLAELRETLDPQGLAPALDQMVLVGHSMGGLVSKLQIIESKDDYWNIVSDQPFQMVKATPELRQGLERTFFFEPNGGVRRVVTIGTPHRGSKFANNTARWLGRRLIALPQRLVQGGSQIRRDNPGLFKDETLLDTPTSIDSLAPDSPILPVMLGAQRPPWVKFHNIVGRIPDEGILFRVSGDGDGAVELASAHLDDADSEIEVQADHINVHRHPRAVLEVRRILLDHLSDLRTEPRYEEPRDRTAAAIEPVTTVTP